jgi:redox-sensitive bicupin YhaK (pirin superfamily)
VTIRSIRRQHRAPLDHPAPGFETRNFGPKNLGAGTNPGAGPEFLTEMDPFVNLDDFVMTQAVFGAHPHAGFSAVTYMFEDSEGTFRNRWSMGDDELIGPGAVHWTQAGAGMFHEEVPTRTGDRCHGLQMFVKLPADQELSPPAAFHMDADDVPEVDADGARVRVLAGSWSGVRAPMPIANELSWLDVHLAPDATFRAPAPADQTVFIVLIGGALVTGDGTQLEPHAGALFERDGDQVVVTAVGEGAQFLYCAGQPLGEPFVASGPFMMRDPDRLQDAFDRMRAGDMGRLDPSF